VKTKCLACRGTNKVGSDSVYLEAYRSSIKQNKRIPEGAKNLAFTIINKLNYILRDLPLRLELAYRRGIQDGKELSNNNHLSKNTIGD